MNDTIAAARTLLFVPGYRPDRFDKAAGSGADLVVLDLEDAVAPDQKDTAREHARTWLAAGNRAVVRINPARTPWHDQDLTAVSGLATALMVPKAESADQIGAVAARAPRAGIIPLIETAAGVTRAVAVCSAAAVVRPAFGSVDLAAQLGIDHCSHEALRHARSALVLAAATAGCGAPIDGVTTALDDEAALQADLDHSVTLGFTGKLCVHPRQVEHANTAFTPSDGELRWAQRVLAAGADGAVASLDGQMIDRPVLLRAEAIVRRAQR
ncbi:HpcH/HpaI aldolase/citrate lyase family protein [Saccharopolyspora sp. NPDC000995]